MKSGHFYPVARVPSFTQLPHGRVTFPDGELEFRWPSGQAERGGVVL